MPLDLIVAAIIIIILISCFQEWELLTLFSTQELIVHEGKCK